MGTTLFSIGWFAFIGFAFIGFAFIGFAFIGLAFIGLTRRPHSTSSCISAGCGGHGEPHPWVNMA